jgi:hypothetical protein
MLAKIAGSPVPGSIVKLTATSGIAGPVAESLRTRSEAKKCRKKQRQKTFGKSSALSKERK